MEIFKTVIFLIGGGFFLSWGAGIFVHAASHLSRRLGVSPLIIGLTIVAFGTSAPEMAVNVLASLQGNSSLAMGNVIGSNIFNVAFILGLCALIKPLFVTSQLIRIDIPIMVVSALCLLAMAWNKNIGQIEAGFLFIGLILYNILQVRLALKEKKSSKEFEVEFSEVGDPFKDSLKLLGGLVMLIGGAKYFVDGAVLGARLLGLSEAVIGLTIIATGTSLPEVATSVAATLKGERDIAIGNVVGSNIFNTLGVIGLSGILSVGGIPLGDHMATIDTPIMVLLVFLCLPFTLWKKELGRFPGLLFFASWLSYMIYLVSSSQT